MIKMLVPFHAIWAMKIAHGEKQYEFRTYPVQAGTKVFIFVTRGQINKRNWLYKTAKANGFVLNEYGWRGLDYEKRFCSGKVIGSFVVDQCIDMENASLETQNDIIKHSGLTDLDLFNYANGRRVFAWHVSQLEIYDIPKNIKEFVYAVYSADMNKATYKADRHLYKAPQKFCYVEENEYDGK